MKGIKGQLSSLPLTDLMQWIEMNKKTGVLFVSKDDSSKCFCFEDGRLLLAASKSEGKRFGDLLTKEGYISYDELEKAISESRKEKTSFIGYLTENKIVPKEFVTAALQQLAEENITEILGWQDGYFEFVEELPKVIAESPVQLSASFLVFESVRKHDELLRQRSQSEA
jgi:hypothetical protein